MCVSQNTVGALGPLEGFEAICWDLALCLEISVLYLHTVVGKKSDLAFSFGAADRPSSSPLWRLYIGLVLFYQT